MTDQPKEPTHDKWARFRFAVVGRLLAAPPDQGELAEKLAELSAKEWLDPVTGEPTTFGVSTIERWYYDAKNAGDDPVAALRRRIRSDSGEQRGMSNGQLRQALLSQYEAHKRWSCQLHYDNLKALAEEDKKLAPVPSYSTVCRFMKRRGLFRRKNARARTEAMRKAADNSTMPTVQSHGLTIAGLLSIAR